MDSLIRFICFFSLLFLYLDYNQFCSILRIAIKASLFWIQKPSRDICQHIRCYNLVI